MSYEIRQTVWAPQRFMIGLTILQLRTESPCTVKFAEKLSLRTGQEPAACRLTAEEAALHNTCNFHISIMHVNYLRRGRHWGAARRLAEPSRTVAGLSGYADSAHAALKAGSRPSNRKTHTAYYRRRAAHRARITS